ncbi:spindle assembly checkpoint component Mad1 [Rhizophagus irregularis DAOM 181602=DAOM 197198]|uniref:Spindle assembly checkpoint component MAD1 n=1 Tax=Rhizophagus irregularis (strain DAOM 181602 / DAOM 197198 / MUCL 43194) TaxID=747089 RepID=A0A2P4PTM1_RHIID|nr:spindle assembly checkpoint component Mad1 [Rhizophagus irregularis DAOM 181602=DAOM 197198]POG68719.1 spindle assembly checkpoint component Mad1 [Rhizophagus irregularis DAOM 181602=DAOM 197198]|eukprot:XP_025175585.1 spindle assembly checkpoint component Mad1 [Rhizophagus irregularis DAOM 181602=DAOM 197198]
MSYPPYQRSAKKNQSQQSDQHNDNPFKPTASTKSTINFTAFSPKNDRELIEARTKIKSLEISKDNLDLKFGRLEAENKSLELKNRELGLQIEGLEKDKDFYYNREKDALKSLENLELENIKLKQAAACETQTLKDKIRELQQNLEDLKTENLIKENDLTRKVQSTELEASKLQYQVENLNEQIRQQHDISASRQKLLNETQQRLDETQEKLNEFNHLSTQLDQIETHNKKVQEQSEHIQELELRNRYLTKEINRNKELSPSIQILQHKLERAEYQLLNMNTLRREAAELEVENTTLKKEKVSWTSLLDQEKDNINSNTPYTVVKELVSRRNEIELLQIRTRSLEEQVRNKDLVIVDHESKIKELRFKYKAMESKFLNEIEASKGSKRLLQKEVEMLMNSLRSYDEEEKQLQSNFEPQKTERIQNLEKLLAEYKEALEQCENKATNIQPKHEEYPEFSELNLHSLENRVIFSNVNLFFSAVKDLKTENASLKEKIMLLDNQIDILERAVGRGEYNKETIRVLEMKDNPASKEFSLRENRLQGLATENQDLKTKLKELYQILENHPTITLELTEDNDSEKETIRVFPIQSYLNLEEENKQLIDQVADKEKRMTRLKEVWKAKAQEYREAVYSLLGYKVEFLENGRVRLTSMYSEQDDHSLVFTSDEDNLGTMQLVDGGNTEYIKSLDNLIKYWVVERGSIPCFLSSLTMDLIGKTALGPIGREMDMTSGRISGLGGNQEFPTLE